MLPKEKADYLVGRFVALSPNAFLVYHKHCALIAVDEMIAEIKLMFPEPYKQQYKYWEDVKKEINNL